MTIFHPTEQLVSKVGCTTPDKNNSAPIEVVTFPPHGHPALPLVKVVYLLPPLPSLPGPQCSQGGRRGSAPHCNPHPRSSAALGASQALFVAKEGRGGAVVHQSIASRKLVQLTDCLLPDGKFQNLLLCHFIFKLNLEKD